MQTAAYLSLALLAALGFYLACAHQRLWPSARTHARVLRGTAWACVAMTIIVAATEMGVLVGVFAGLTAIMLGAVGLPYVDAWLQLRRRQSDVG